MPELSLAGMVAPKEATAKVSGTGPRVVSTN